MKVWILLLPTEEQKQIKNLADYTIQAEYSAENFKNPLNMRHIGTIELFNYNSYHFDAIIEKRG